MPAEILSLLKVAVLLICSHILQSAVVAELPQSPQPLPQTPPFPLPDVKHCWSSLESVNGCLSEIYASFLNGRIGWLGPSCCQAISNISTSCWTKMFPYSPCFPPLLKDHCATNGVPTTTPMPPAVQRDSSPLPLTSTLSGYRYPTLPGKCLLSVQNNQGCIDEVIASFFSFRVGLLGPKCCRAIAAIGESCWPRIFQFNPFFPPLVKNYCANLTFRTPTRLDHTPRY